MGRIRQKFIKKRAFELVDSHTEFSGDFRQNKKVLGEFAETRGKKIKNKLAGYITKIAKRKKEY